MKIEESATFLGPYQIINMRNPNRHFIKQLVDIQLGKNEEERTLERSVIFFVCAEENGVVPVEEKEWGLGFFCVCVDYEINKW